MSGKHGLSFITAVVLLVCLQHVLADTKQSANPPAPRGHRSTSNVEFLPSVSRTLPSTRYFDRSQTATRRSHHARRVAHGKPPPYAVQMEPLFQYSQRDPLYQESADKNKDTISKKFSSGPGVFVNHHGTGNLVAPYQSTFYVTPQPSTGGGHSNNYHNYNTYYHGGDIPPGYIILKEPEPIIEIIVKESNHTLPPPIVDPTTPKPREPVHVFFVKYKKDAHGSGVQYEKPVPAITPATPLVSEPVEEPAPYYNTPQATVEPPPSTTLRTVINPDSETIHVNDGGLRISFGQERSLSDHHHHSGHQNEGSYHGDTGHHVEGSEPQPTFAKTPSPPVQQQAQHSAPVQQHAQPSAQVHQHVQSSAPVQHHSQPTKRQQPSARFHAAPFQQPFGSDFQGTEQNRFLSPPPVQSQSSPQFNPNFASSSQDRQSFSSFPQSRPSFGPPQRANQPQFAGKIESPPFQFESPTFQQQNNFQSSPGKLEVVPFKQPSTGKLELGLAGNTFNQPPAFPPFRVHEPINGLPPPPPPQSFQRQPPPSFFQQPQFNPRPAPPRPSAPQFSKPTFNSQPPTFSQQIASFPQPSPPNTQHTQQPPFVKSAPQHPPKFSQPLPSGPQQSPKFSQPLPSPQQPSFTSPGFSGPSFSSPSFTSFTSLPQNSFSFVPPFSRLPEVTTVSSTTTQQTAQPTTQRPHSSFDSEIVQSLSPSTAELQRQQQQQFKQEQQYYQEIQKLQQEIEVRNAQKAQSTTTKKPFDKHPVFTPTTSRTTTTTETPKVETPPSNASAPNLSNFVLPDEVPDDLRQQLLASGILNNADIQILDYDKVGDIPLENLPQEALQQFIGAGGGGAVGAGSAPIPQFVPAPAVKRVSTDAEDSAAEASDRVETQHSPVEMKVVRYAPGNEQAAANQYVRSDATTLDPVVLNDNAYSRYLPLQVAGARFPLPDVPELRGRNVTSVVVLAPVAPSVQTFARRSGHVEPTKEDDVEFVAGPILKDLVNEPSEDNFKKWLQVENSTASNKQSIILLVADKDPKSVENKEEETAGQDIFMYDVGTQQVSKLRGELSAAFVEVALANSGNSQENKNDYKSETKVQEKKPENPTKSDIKSISTEDSKATSSNKHVTISSSYSKTKQ